MFPLGFPAVRGFQESEGPRFIWGVPVTRWHLSQTRYAQPGQIQGTVGLDHLACGSSSRNVRYVCAWGLMLELLVKLILLPIWLPLKLLGELIEHSGRPRSRRRYASRSGTTGNGCLVILGILFPGTGSLALGRMRGGLILLGFIVSVVFLVGASSASSAAFGTFLVVAAAFWLWGMVDWSTAVGVRQKASQSRIQPVHQSPLPDVTITPVSRTAAADRPLDPLFVPAARLVASRRTASVGLLTTELHVGYSRAGRLMDELAKHRVIGPHAGAKPRSVLMTMSGVDELARRLGLD
jgi:hypothetical protein